MSEDMLPQWRSVARHFCAVVVNSNLPTPAAKSLCAQKKDVPLCRDHRYMLTIGKMGEEAFFDA